MKIVLAVPHFPPRYTGGAEGYAHRVAREIGRRGHGVRVVCVEHIDRGPAGGVAAEDDVYDGVAVRRLSFRRAAAPDVFRWDYDNPWIGDHVRALLERERPDVFHLVSGYLLSARPLREAQGLGIPTVVTLTDFWFLCPRITMLRSDGRLSAPPTAAAACARCLGEERRRYRLLGRLAPALMDAVWRRRAGAVQAIEARTALLRDALGHATLVSPSRFVRDMHVQAGLAADRIVVSPHGLELSASAPAHRSRSASGALRIGYLGQIAWHKGVHVLLEAFRRKPQAPMTAAIYGDPTAFPAYAERLRQHATGDERIVFHGPYRGHEALRRALDDIDVVAVPSLWYENHPTVILEAFAHGVPVIATDLGGMREMVRHGGDGLLFERGDAADLARQLQRLIDETGLLPALRRGVPPVRSVGAEIDDLLETYAAAVAGPRPPALRAAAGEGVP